MAALALILEFYAENNHDDYHILEFNSLCIEMDSLTF
jgi:hypothetical protein